MLTGILDGVTLRRNERATSPLASVAAGDSTDKIAGKIQHAEKAKVLMMFVIGGHDMYASAVSVRLHGQDPQAAKPKGGSRDGYSGGD